MLDYYKILKNTSYRWMIGSNIINRFGDSLDSIGFMWLAYQISNNGSWPMFILAVQTFPTIVIQPFSSTFVEKMNKKNVMILCDLARSACVFSILFLYCFNTLSIYHLAFFIFLHSTFETFRVPAGIAIVPSLLKPDDVQQGISLNMTASRLIELIGIGIAGLIVSRSSVLLCILIDGISFVVSALFLSQIQINKQIFLEHENFKTYKSNLKDGFIYIINHKTILHIIFVGFFINGLVCPIDGLLPILIDKTLRVDKIFYSFFIISITIGQIVGCSCVSFVRSKKWLYYSFGFVFCFYISLCIFTNPYILSLSFFLLGWISGLLSTYVTVLLTTTTDSSYLARVGGCFNSFITGSIPIISTIVGLSISYLNIKYTLWILATIAIITLYIFRAIIPMKKEEM